MTTSQAGDEGDRRLYPSLGEDRAQALSPMVAALVATVADAVPKLPFDVDVSQYYTLLESFADVDD